MNEAEKFLQEHLAKAQRPQPSAPQVQTTPFASGAQNDNAAVVGKQQMVSMGEAFKRFWVNWSLNGRSSRSEFWFAVLANFILGFLNWNCNSRNCSDCSCTRRSGRYSFFVVDIMAEYCYLGTAIT